MSIRILLLTLSFTLSSVAYGDECHDLIVANKYDQGLEVCTKAAEQGHANAQYNLGQEI